ncbi:sensor histidine kinase [Actinomadura hibisca]|uniref:sensor histidine kinase n=1 Tax=Actinomadura hibisca TaxID=68565 RepID=UPI00082DC4BB|nr:HAMP domain-containing sensor histidine kinase [Actinomadura hibisca]
MLNHGDHLDRTAPCGTDASDTVRAILALLQGRLRSPDAPGTERSNTVLLDGLRAAPGVVRAELRPAEAGPEFPGERVWPAGPGRSLAVTLQEDADGCGVAEALGCLAATIEAGAGTGTKAETEAGTGAGTEAETGAGTGAEAVPGTPDGTADALEEAALRLDHAGMIGTVVHDLTTPLTPILAYAGLLSDPDTGPLTDVQRQFAQVIERNALRLSELLHDLPLLADPTAPSSRRRLEPVDPMELAHKVVSRFREDAHRADVALLCQARRGPTLRCDPVRVRRMLDILVSGALAAAGPGDTVTVVAEPAEQGWRIGVAWRLAEPAPTAGPARWPRESTARAIAAMHGGTLRTTADAEGRSAVAQLPWEPPSPDEESVQ